jgi:hypothetical protein
LDVEAVEHRAPEGRRHVDNDLAAAVDDTGGQHHGISAEREHHATIRESGARRTAGDCEELSRRTSEGDADGTTGRDDGLRNRDLDRLRPRWGGQRAEQAGRKRQRGEAAQTRKTRRHYQTP